MNSYWTLGVGIIALVLGLYWSPFAELSWEQIKLPLSAVMTALGIAGIVIWCASRSS